MCGTQQKKKDMPLFCRMLRQVPLQALVNARHILATTPSADQALRRLREVQHDTEEFAPWPIAAPWCPVVADILKPSLNR